jgi:hypothetical protein
VVEQKQKRKSKKTLVSPCNLALIYEEVGPNTENSLLQLHAGWPTRETRSGNQSKRSEWNSCSDHGIRRKDWNLHLHGNEETDSSKELPKRIPDSGMNGDTEPEQSVV